MIIIIIPHVFPRYTQALCLTIIDYFYVNHSLDIMSPVKIMLRKETFRSCCLRALPAR